MTTSVSHHGRALSVKGKVLIGRGAVSVSVVNGHRHATIHAKRTQMLSRFTATLTPGRWKVAVRCAPAAGDTAPARVVRWATITPDAR
jgi:hypothetical protein